MKESKWRKDGMKMLIDSGWKEFDRQTNYIVEGSAECNTQFSNYIRPWKETECNGFTNSEGHLTMFDLNGFSNQKIPKDIKNYLLDKKREESVILYMFFTKDKDKHLEPFCWVITSGYPENKLIMCRVECPYGKSFNKRDVAAKEAISYITI